MTSDSRLRVALLITDTPAPPVVDRCGDYKVMFTSLLEKAASAHVPAVDVQVVPFDVRHAQVYPEDLSTFDAALITGSAADAYRDDPWIVKLVDWCANLPETFKVVGICFGHQIIGRAYGATCEINPKGWEVGWTDVPLNAVGAKLLGMNHIRINQMHQDHLSSLPPRGPFESIGATDMTPCQGLYLPGRFLTFQGHPEFSSAVIEELVAIRKANGVFSPEFTKDILDRNHCPLDNVSLGSSILQFISS